VIAIAAAAAAAFVIAWIWYDLDSGAAVAAIAVVYTGNQQAEPPQVRPAVSLESGDVPVNVRVTRTQRPDFDYAHPEREIPADRNHFADSIFFGDLMTAAIPFYGVAPEAGVLAFEGDDPAGAAERLVYIEGEYLLIPQAAKILYGERANIYIMFSAISFTGNIEEFIAGYGVFVDIVRQSFPDANIFIQSVLPVTYTAGLDNRAIANGVINEHNLALMQFARQGELIYLDVAYALTDSTGHLLPERAPADGIHLSAEGYHIWFDYLRWHW